MSDHARNQAAEADRREFLKTAGRFAAVTPPAMTLLLSTTMSSPAIAKSGGGGTTPTDPDCKDPHHNHKPDKPGHGHNGGHNGGGHNGGGHNGGGHNGGGHGWPKPKGRK